jgi:hypothetical protein
MTPTLYVEAQPPATTQPEEVIIQTPGTGIGARAFLITDFPISGPGTRIGARTFI